jgi:FkbM family methyltransferase
MLSKLILSTKNNLVSLEKPYQSISHLLKNNRITGIIDAGASNGSVSKRLLRFFPEADVYAFEPNPLYRETLLSFSREEKRLKPEFRALSDHEGVDKLFVTQAPGSTSLLRPLNIQDENYSQRMKIKNEESVEVVTIDGWIASKENLDIHLIKFDIQGGELSALQGATNALNNSILLVYTEILFTPLYQEGALYSEIDLFLRKFGFELYDIYGPKYNLKGQLAYANAIFLNTEKMAVG